MQLKHNIISIKHTNLKENKNNYLCPPNKLSAHCVKTKTKSMMTTLLRKSHKKALIII